VTRPVSELGRPAALPIRLFWAKASIALAVLLAPAGVVAQVAVGISMKSDERFRGRSLSDGRPVATLDVSLDSRSGPYLGGSATATLTGKDRAGLLGAQTYVGYATRTPTGVALDMGIAGYHFTNRYSGNRADRYVEVYAGRRSRYDTRIGVTRTIGAFEAQAAWTFAGPDGPYFQGPWHGRSAITLSLRRSF